MTASGTTRLILRWLPLLVLGPLLAAACGYAIASRAPSVYEATVTLLVQPADTTGTQDTQVAQDLATTYAEAIHTRQILSQAASQVGLGYLSERELESRVQARRITGTQLLRVSVDDTDPQRAAQLANTVVQVFLNANAQLQADHYNSSIDNLGKLVGELQQDITSRTQQISDLQNQPASPQRDTQLAQLASDLTQVQSTYSATLRSYQDLRVSAARGSNTLTVFDPAVPPEDPIGPNRTLTPLLAALAGLAVVGGIVGLAEYLGDHLSDPEHIAERTGLRTLGFIPNSGSNANDPANRGVAEMYRVLRNNLAFDFGAQPIHSLVIASAAAGDGKSTIAANLARAFAEVGRRVILVDADLYQPKQMQLFGLGNARGLATYLKDETWPVAALVQPTASSNLRVLTAGPIADELPSLLASTRLGTLLAELRGDCDVLLIDTPPVLAQSDAVLISPYCDGVLFVIDAKRTRGRQAERALGQLRYSGAALLGAILNRAPRNIVHPVPYDHRSWEEAGTPTNGHTPAPLELSDIVVPTKDAGRAR